jgi:hypothetical protein
MPNLRSIKEEGIRKFASQQARRIRFLQTMLESYDDGRSKSFFCRAAALLDPTALRRSLESANKALSTSKAGELGQADKAKILRALLAEAASREGVELGAKK